MTGALYIDGIPQILQRLTSMEATMSELSDAVHAAIARVNTDFEQALATHTADQATIQSLRDEMAAAVAALANLDPDPNNPVQPSDVPGPEPVGPEPAPVEPPPEPPVV